MGRRGRSPFFSSTLLNLNFSTELGSHTHTRTRTQHRTQRSTRESNTLLFYSPIMPYPRLARYLSTCTYSFSLLTDPQCQNARFACFLRLACSRQTHKSHSVPKTIKLCTPILTFCSTPYALCRKIRRNRRRPRGKKEQTTGAKLTLSQFSYIILPSKYNCLAMYNVQLLLPSRPSFTFFT